MFDLTPFESRQKDLFNAFNDAFFGDFGKGAVDVRTDIVDQGDAFELRAEMPGFQKEDIHLELKDGLLTISAQHHAETEDKKENYVRRERRYGRYTRSFDVSNIDTAAIRARYENGVLYLNLPKAKPVQPVSQQIAIE